MGIFDGLKSLFRRGPEPTEEELRRRRKRDQDVMIVQPLPFDASIPTSDASAGESTDASVSSDDSSGSADFGGGGGFDGGGSSDSF